MFMSVVARDRHADVYPELAGARVLISGLTSVQGVDVVRAFADHNARLVVQSPETSHEIASLFALLTQTASEIKLFTDPIRTADAATRFAQGPAQALGGLDVAINLIAFEHADLDGRSSLEEVEEVVSQKLLPATLLTRIAANRMRLTLGEGLVLNVVQMPEPRNDRERAMAGLVGATLAAMTRVEASQWADQAIRINAVGPRGVVTDGGRTLASEPDIAALALFLASRKGRNLSGHVFDSAGAHAAAA